MNVFDLEAFAHHMEIAPVLGEDEVASHTRTIEVMRMVLDSDHASVELLALCTVEELEWVFDLLLFWPSWDQEIHPEDYLHEGVQHMQMRNLVEELSQQKSIKRKVTFI